MAICGRSPKMFCDSTECEACIALRAASLARLVGFTFEQPPIEIVTAALRMIDPECYPELRNAFEAQLSMYRDALAALRVITDADTNPISTEDN